MRLTSHRRSVSQVSMISDTFELMQPRPPSLATRMRAFTRSLRCSRWRTRNLLIAFGVFLLTVFYLSSHNAETPTHPNTQSLPGRQDFQDYEERLRRMPQHNFGLPPPAGRNGHYVRFRNQVKDLG